MADLNPQIGSNVLIKTKNNEFKGLIVNSSSEGFTLKLSSGYNVFVPKKDIQALTELSGPKEPTKTIQKEIPFSQSLPTISILQIGGTIASRVDYETGAVKVTFDPKELLAMYPELYTIANCKPRVVGQMFSEDIRFAHYTKLAREIKKEIEQQNPKGIIIPHGTDTMHYTSAALEFMLENLSIPVILVGSQRSTDRGSSDAAQNLVAAAQFIAKTDFKGIAICMHETTQDDACVILPATKTRKLHTSRRDAFKPVNTGPVARVFIGTGKIDFLSEQNTVAGQFVLREKFEEKVAILKARPNLHWQEIDFFRKQKYKGLVIEGTGLGQASVGVPDELAKPNKKNLQALQKLVKSGCTVVMTTQCIFGSVQMHVYQDAVYLTRAGVIPGHDMTTETAFVKLAWLLANFPKKEVAGLMEKNMRREINDRLQMDFFPPKNL